MLPVVAMTAVFNAILVGALYLPIQKALKFNQLLALRATPLGVHSSLTYSKYASAPLSRQPGAPRKAGSVLHHQRLSQTTSSWGRS